MFLEKIYTTGKSFTLPPGLTGWTNFTSAITIHILKAYDESYSKIIRGHKNKDKDNDKDNDKDKYDHRYLTLVILFTPVTLITLVTLFQPYIQFYRAECITVSGFFIK